MSMPLNVLSDVWRFVDNTGGPDACWPWVLSRSPRGYGRFSIGKKTLRAHRAAFEAATGIHPGELVVRHKCDNPPCCNPAHLELGTNADNSQDMRTRGRSKKGLDLAHTKLSDEQVAAIRNEYATGSMTLRGMAAAFGVSRTQICNIVYGKQRVA